MSRGEGKPKLRELRESGSIEQSGHLIMLLNNRKIRSAIGKPLDIIELDIAKNKDGPCSELLLRFEGAHYSFTAPSDSDVAEYKQSIERDEMEF
jgi:replicative DNA helicase